MKYNTQLSCVGWLLAALLNVCLARAGLDEGPMQRPPNGSGKTSQPPELICPSNRVVWTCENEIRVEYSVKVAEGSSPNVSVKCDPPSGSLFSIGQHWVTCTAEDEYGQSSSCGFQITVKQDTQAPFFRCPTNRIVQSTSPNGVAVSFTARAMDDGDTNVTVTCTPPSGSILPPGTTLVSCFAEDDCGNIAKCSFTVTVIWGNSPPVLAPVKDITVHAGTAAAMTLFARDSDPPPNPLKYSLKNAPEGARLDPKTGRFSWTPSPAEAFTTNRITAVVTDDGSPPLMDEETFTVTVAAPLAMQSMGVKGDQVRFAWNAIPGHKYGVGYKSSLSDKMWQEMTTVVPNSPLATFAQSLLPLGQHFYRLWDFRVILCPIDWQPSVLTPVFYGIQDFEEGGGVPGNMRVFYPSLDGAVWDAPLLEGCGRYPLVVFVHGNCGNADHYKKWYHLPAQLARSGYVVVVPELPATAGGTYPWYEDHPDLTLLADVLTWMREDWEHSYILMPPPATGIIGHSYGALLGARLAADVPASAYVSLSGVWNEWGGLWPAEPLVSLDVSSLFAWGQGGDVQAQLGTGLWDLIALPKHSLAFEQGEHWDYLPVDSSPPEVVDCEDSPRGPCDLVKLLAADYVATFMSKYLPPEDWPDLGDLISADLLPPAYELSMEQQFFAGGHLAGFSLLPAPVGCGFTHSWETP